MPSVVKILRVVADPNRLRILLLLDGEELSVAELQEILTMGQSTLSTHLSQLRQAGLVEDRRTGKNILYRLAIQPPTERTLPPANTAPTQAEAWKGHDPAGTPATQSNALKGHDFSRANSGDHGLNGEGTAFSPYINDAEKGHDFRPADTAESNELKGTAFSPYINDAEKGHDFRHADTAESNELKGTGFSPYIHDAENSGPSGPEGMRTQPASDPLLHNLLARAAREIPEAPADQDARRRVLRKRQDKMRAFFDSVAGRLGRNYVPGKSWKSLAEALLRLLPPLRIADLGAGEGSFALLLAQRAVHVIAVDSSAKMIEVGREEARRNHVANIDFRLGDMEELPIAPGEVDLVFFSQSLHHALHPARALHEAARILAPGGRIVILDLAKHRFEEAREMYADEWLGFSESELESLLHQAHFTHIETSIVDKEPDQPQFQTLLAVAGKPS